MFIFQISSKVEEDSASLTIKKVVDTDVGNYVVKLKNSVGEASAELTLIIIGLIFIMNYFYIMNYI